ncbi:MAG: hypothetical protein U5J63_16080, partial [Fodinibius sp.]|nr:hypothetical protein [Fodinibius sp.]
FSGLYRSATAEYRKIHGISLIRRINFEGEILARVLNFGRSKSDSGQSDSGRSLFGERPFTKFCESFLFFFFFGDRPFIFFFFFFFFGRSLNFGFFGDSFFFFFGCFFWSFTIFW